MKRRDRWIINYNYLVEYYNKYGNIDVSLRYVTKDNVKLGIWLNTQRQYYNGTKKGNLSIKQIELLNKLGMKWNPHQDTWNEKYQILLDYYNEYGNIDVSRNFIYKDLCLDSWLNTQREAYNGIKGLKLTEEQIEKLELLGIKWNLSYDKWMDNYLKLKNYYLNNPFYQDKKMDYWVCTQRRNYKLRKLSTNKIKLLNDINFDWSYTDTRYLNKKISIDTVNEYNYILLNRLKSVLIDIENEVINEIDTKKDVEKIEKELVRRIWR